MMSSHLYKICTQYFPEYLNLKFTFTLVTCKLVLSAHTRQCVVVSFRARQTTHTRHHRYLTPVSLYTTLVPGQCLVVLQVVVVSECCLARPL